MTCIFYIKVGKDGEHNLWINHDKKNKLFYVWYQKIYQQPLFIAELETRVKAHVCLKKHLKYALQGNLVVTSCFDCPFETLTDNAFKKCPVCLKHNLYQRLRQENEPLNAFNQIVHKPPHMDAPMKDSICTFDDFLDEEEEEEEDRFSFSEDSGPQRLSEYLTRLFE